MELAALLSRRNKTFIPNKVLMFILSANVVQVTSPIKGASPME